MKNAYLLDPRFAITQQGPFSLKDHSSDLLEETVKKELKAQLDDDKKAIAKIQHVFYTSGTPSMLLILGAKAPARAAPLPDPVLIHRA